MRWVRCSRLCSTAAAILQQCSAMLKASTPLRKLSLLGARKCTDAWLQSSALRQGRSQRPSPFLLLACVTACGYTFKQLVLPASLDADSVTLAAAALAAAPPQILAALRGPCLDRMQRVSYKSCIAWNDGRLESDKQEAALRESSMTCRAPVTHLCGFRSSDKRDYLRGGQQARNFLPLHI